MHRPGRGPSFMPATALLTVLMAGAACSPPGDGPSFDDAAELTSPSVTPTASPAAPPSPAPARDLPTATPVQIADRPLPATQAELIDALTEAETAIRDPTIGDATAAGWGQRQQRLYSVLADNAEWHAEVLDGVDRSVRLAVKGNLDARLALTSLVESETLADTLPAWRLRDPLPAAELVGYYRDAEAQTGIPWTYLAAIHLVETRMGRIEGLSTAGATGPMQFLPSTWAECCEGDPTLDRDAISGAAVYLAQSGGLDDIRAAVFRYNNSDRYVEGITAYAEVMAENELAYRGYHAWQVYLASAAGLLRLPAGYYEPEPVAVDDWLADHPDALVVAPDP